MAIMNYIVVIILGNFLRWSYIQIHNNMDICMNVYMLYHIMSTIIFPLSRVCNKCIVCSGLPYLCVIEDM